MYPSTFLVIGGMLSFGVGAAAFYGLMPKLRTRERRGELATPVPDPQESRTAAIRLLALIWTLRTSEERPRFRRHVMLVRWAPIVGVSLMLSSFLVMRGEARPKPEVDSNTPPPVRISISDGSEPVSG